MTTPFKVANKIDDFAIEISILDISELTHGLLQLQHARYPHLVPMYRTIHRTKPRAMVLRAIRWVNPKRMFPGAGLTIAEMKGMSSDDLEKLIVDLNDYRGEAHVIHNRYNHMIELINMGELPYFIPYAGFKQDKWSMLQEYMDRALRLKEGTEAWEQVLDSQAIEIRHILLKRKGGDRRKLDDIDGLWVDAKGQPAAPNFMDVKKGKEKKIALRANRISKNGKRVRHAPKVFVRRFAAVHPQEARRGEVIRMPAMGKIGRPGRDRPTARRIFDEHGGAAGHLVRMPKAWSLQTNSEELRAKGNMISMPAGRKDPMILTFQELDFDAVANRREARWTQPDPLGKRGVARHRGGASAAPGGHREEGMDTAERQERQDRQALRNVRQRQQNVEERRRRGRRARGGGEERPPADQGDPKEEGIKINKEFREASAGLFQKYNVDDTSIKEMQAITGADLTSIKLLGQKSHAVNAGQGLVLELTLKNGKKYVYKMVLNEQKSEEISTAIDKVLGLNVNRATTIFNDISIEDLARVGFTPGNAAVFQDHINNGGGHLQEFCEPNCIEARNVDERDKDGNYIFGGPEQELKNYKNPEFRGNLHRMHINDWITGNWDRHRGNYMLTDGGKGLPVQIDTGFGAGLASVHNDERNPISDRGRMFAGNNGGVESRRPHTIGQRGDPMFDAIQVSKGDIQKELEAVFDQFVTVEKIADIQQAFGMRNKNENMSIDELKQNFIKQAGHYWGATFSSPVDTFGQTAANNNMDTNNLNPLFGEGGGAGPQADREGDTADFVRRFRDQEEVSEEVDTQADRDENAAVQQEYDDRQQAMDENFVERQRGRRLNTEDREELNRIGEGMDQDQAERDASAARRAVQYDAENREVAQEAGASERRGAARRRQERTSTPAGVGADEPRGVSGFTDSPGMRADESSRRGMEDEDFDISEDEDRNINTSEIDRALASDDDESMSGKGDSRVRGFTDMPDPGGPRDSSRRRREMGQTRGSRDTLGNRN